MSKNLNKTLEENSIYDNVTIEDSENEISLILNSDLKKSVMIVEGISDFQFWENFMDKDHVEILESIGGKFQIDSIIENTKNSRIFGIRDRDYEEIISERIFLYDYNCLEIMLINSRIVFESLCKEYYFGSENIETLKLNVFKELKYLSIIRMHNSKEGLRIRLENIVDSCYENNKINNIKLIKEIERRIKEEIDYKTKKKFDDEFLKEWNEEEYLNFTRGHDYIELLTKIFNENRERIIPKIDKKGKIHYKETKNKEKCVKFIEDDARKFFNFEELKKTKIFSLVSEYEQNHNLTIFIKE